MSSKSFKIIYFHFSDWIRSALRRDIISLFLIEKILWLGMGWWGEHVWFFQVVKFTVASCSLEESQRIFLFILGNYYFFEFIFITNLSDLSAIKTLPVLFIDCLSLLSLLKDIYQFYDWRLLTALFAEILLAGISPSIVPDH